MTVVATDKAPAAVGPYSQARIHGDLLFVSGQLPLDPSTSTMPEDPVDQMRQAIRNIAAIAEAAGTTLAATLKTTVLVTDLSRWADLNAEYARHFQPPYPARATYEVAALPLAAKVEVEAVIAVGQPNNK